MFGLILLALIVIPLIELFLVVQVAQTIEIGPTIVLLLGISLLGGWLVRREGAGVWRRIQEAMMGGSMPSNELADGALIVFGGTLLLTPGFLTDAFGLAMLIPPLRAPVRKLLVSRTRNRAQTRVQTFGFGMPPQAGHGTPFGQTGSVIDVEEVNLERTDGPQDQDSGDRPELS